MTRVCVLKAFCLSPYRRNGYIKERPSPAIQRIRPRATEFVAQQVMLRYRGVMPVAVGGKVEALRADFRSAAQLADLLGVNRSQVMRWLRGAGIDPLNAEKVDLLDLVWSNLLRLYDRDAALSWLFGVNPSLGDRRPGRSHSHGTRRRADARHQGGTIRFVRVTALHRPWSFTDASRGTSALARRMRMGRCGFPGCTKAKGVTTIPIATAASISRTTPFRPSSSNSHGFGVSGSCLRCFDAAACPLRWPISDSTIGQSSSTWMTRSSFGASG